MIGVVGQNNTIHLAIATWEWPSYFDPGAAAKGIRLDLGGLSPARSAHRAGPAKAAGLYMICTISKHAAERKAMPTR